MLCENKIRPQFNFCIIIITCTVLSTFVLPSLKVLVLFEGLVFSLKVGHYILCDPTDNFATSGTSRIYYSAFREIILTHHFNQLVSSFLVAKDQLHKE